MTVPPGHDPATCVCPACVAHRKHETAGFSFRPATVGGLLLVAGIVAIALVLAEVLGS